MNKTKNQITRVFSLNSYADTNGIEIQTDADLYGGDTASNISYNIKENSRNSQFYLFKKYFSHHTRIFRNEK